MPSFKGCSQKGCDLLPMYRYTWPGHDEAAVCLIHAQSVQGIANTMSFPLQLIKLEPLEIQPRDEQEVSDE